MDEAFDLVFELLDLTNHQLTLNKFPIHRTLIVFLELIHTLNVYRNDPHVFSEKIELLIPQFIAMDILDWAKLKFNHELDLLHKMFYFSIYFFLISFPRNMGNISQLHPIAKTIHPELSLEIFEIASRLKHNNITINMASELFFDFGEFGVAREVMKIHLIIVSFVDFLFLFLFHD